MSKNQMKSKQPPAIAAASLEKKPLPPGKYPQLLGVVFQKNHSQIKKILEGYAIDLNQKVTARGETKAFFHWACEYQDPVLWQMIITNGVGLLEKRVPQFLVTNGFSVDHFILFNKRFPEALKEVTIQGTLLHYLARTSQKPNSVAIADFLIQEAKVDIDAVDSLGHTAAYYALSKENSEIATALQRHNSKLNQSDKQYVALIDKMIQFGEAKISEQKANEFWDEFAAEPENSLTVLHVAIRRNDLEKVKTICPRVDVNLRCLVRNVTTTALDLAARLGYFDIARYLLEQKADVEKGEERGSTPLMGATFSGHSDMVAFLLETGQANPNAVDKRSNPVLFFAIEHSGKETGIVRCIELLLQFKADVNYARPGDGLTALFLAINLDHHQQASALLESKTINPNIKTCGMTPLLNAAVQGKLAMISILLKDPRVDKDAFSNQGLKVTHIALLYGNLPLMRLLLNSGVSPAQMLASDDSATLADMIIGLNRYDFWCLLKDYAILLSENVIRMVMNCKISREFMSDLLTTFAKHLKGNPLLYEWAIHLIGQNYSDLLPILLPDIQIEGVSKSELKRRVYDAIRTPQRDSRQNLPAIADAVSRNSSDLDFWEHKAPVLQSGMSGRQYLKKEGIYVTNESLTQFENPMQLQRVLSAGAALTLFGRATRSWFGGQLDSKSERVMQITRRINIPNAFIYIDPSLEENKDPAIKALLNKQEWALSGKNGIKKITGKLEKTYYSLSNRPRVSVQVEITHEISSGSAAVQHQRVFVFRIPADDGRGVLFVATAGLIAEKGLGDRIYRPPDFVTVTLPPKLTSSQKSAEMVGRIS